MAVSGAEFRSKSKQRRSKGKLCDGRAWSRLHCKGGAEPRMELSSNGDATGAETSIGNAENGKEISDSRG